MNLVTIDTSSNMPLYIGPNNATSVIIGNTNCPLNILGELNLYKNIKLGSGIIAPQNNTYLGYIENFTQVEGTAASAIKNMFTFTLPSAGTWLIVASYEWIDGATQNTNLSLSTTSLVNDYFSIGTLVSGTGNFLQLTKIVQTTSTSTPVYTISSKQMSFPLTKAKVYSKATRIA